MECTDAFSAFSVRALQQKWKNIRDCFRKEFNYQRQIKAGKKKRRRYIFYNQLLFLLPTLKGSGETITHAGTERPELEKPLPEPTVAPISFQQNMPEDEAQFGTQEGTVEAIDEDKYFLLSLMPSFRRMSSDQKFACKIEMLQLLRNHLHPVNHVESPVVSEIEFHPNNPKLETFD